MKPIEEKYSMEEARERLGLVRFLMYADPETASQFCKEKGIREPIPEILEEADELERMVYGSDFGYKGGK